MGNRVGPRGRRAPEFAGKQRRPGRMFRAPKQWLGGVFGLVGGVEEVRGLRALGGRGSGCRCVLEGTGRERIVRIVRSSAREVRGLRLAKKSDAWGRTEVREEGLTGGARLAERVEGVREAMVWVPCGRERASPCGLARCCCC